MGLQGMLDYQTLIDAFPFFAMVLDENHDVIAANAYFAEETAKAELYCPIQCFPAVHDTAEPPPGCPLTEARETGATAERIVDMGRYGRLRVSVYPLMTETAGGLRLFLHLARPESVANDTAG